MIIEDYGCILTLYFRDGSEEVIPVSSWEDIPNLPLSKFNSCHMTHNKSKFWRWERLNGMTHSDLNPRLSSGTKQGKSGWPLRYFIRLTTYPANFMNDSSVFS